MKKILLASCFTISTFMIDAQTLDIGKVPFNVFNKYLIKIDSTLILNTPLTSEYIKQVCAASNIDYNVNTKYFEVFTKKDLERNIIEGKLRKNATPLSDFIFVGKANYSPNSTSSTISAE